MSVVGPEQELSADDGRLERGAGRTGRTGRTGRSWSNVGEECCSRDRSSGDPRFGTVDTVVGEDDDGVPVLTKPRPFLVGAHHAIDAASVGSGSNVGDAYGAVTRTVTLPGLRTGRGVAGEKVDVVTDLLHVLGVTPVGSRVNIFQHGGSGGCSVARPEFVPVVSCVFSRKKQFVAENDRIVDVSRRRSGVDFFDERGAV